MKVAVVTGASRGIGRASALALAEDGWAVAIGYRSNEQDAKETLAAVERTGAKGVAVYLDVTDEASVAEGFGQATSTLGPVTGLVANAGVTRDGLAVKYRTAEFDRTMETNARGAFLCARAALRSMLRERFGRIVFMTSAVALRGNAGQVAYATSKAALVGMARSLAREVGSRGVTVNCVAPGFVETEMTAGVSGEARRALLEQTPVGRPASLEEVAAAVRFLFSDEAAYVNGVVLPVDGGLTA